MSKSVIYWVPNGVLKRQSTDPNPPYDQAFEAIHQEEDDFNPGPGYWKYDASFAVLPATEQEYTDANVDQGMKALKQALMDFHNSALAFQAADQVGTGLSNYSQFKPYFKDILRDLDKAMQQIWKNMQ